MPEREDAEVGIIRLLKKEAGSFVSGQAISSLLGISRTAVWKHIKGLKKMGYSIAASPSKGYCLSVRGKAPPFNAAEISSGLATGFIGRKIFFYPELVSTNLKAFELGRAGEPEGTAVIADAQTGGKGRIGRRWVSPPSVNLYTSIILRPDVAPSSAHMLTLLSAVAAAEAVGGFIDVRPEVKWPNDILIDSRKVAGILMEMDAEPDRVNFVVAGIGININMAASAMPEEIRKNATSLKEKAGKEVSRVDVARELYASFEKWYKIFKEKGFLPIINEWRSYFAAEGKTLKIVSFNRTVEGVCAGIDRDGALLVRMPSGAIERVISGDVEMVRPL